MHPLRPYFTKVIDFVGLRKKTIIEKIGQMKEEPVEQPQEEMRQIPPEETMGALKGIA